MESTWHEHTTARGTLQPAQVSLELESPPGQLSGLVLCLTEFMTKFVLVIELKWKKVELIKVKLLISQKQLTRI